MPGKVDPVIAEAADQVAFEVIDIAKKTLTNGRSMA
jgi:aspartate ammonia-lyase